MTGLLNAIGLVKGLAAVGALSAATAFAGVNAGTPHTNAAPTARPPQVENAGNPVATILENQADLLDHMKSVLAALEANPNVNEHATAALEKLIARLGDTEHGLLNAAAHVAAQGPLDKPDASHPVPSLPPQAVSHPTPPDHPTPSDHPTASDHPTSSSHPGRP